MDKIELIGRFLIIVFLVMFGFYNLGNGNVTDGFLSFILASIIDRGYRYNEGR